MAVPHEWQAAGVEGLDGMGGSLRPCDPSVTLRRATGVEGVDGHAMWVG